MTDSGARLERDGAIATLWFDRPAVKNAFTIDMMDLVADLIREADRDPDVHAIIVTGAGGAFCSGIELGALASVENHPVEHKAMLTDHIHQVLYALDTCATPVIAAINGPAVGAGLDMALACDIRLAACSARMSEGYVRVGLVPGDGGCFFLPAIVGLGHALDMLMTGRFVGAEEAERMGLVSRVLEDDELLDAAREMAERLALFPQPQLGIIKRAARQSARLDLRTHLDLMSSHLGVVMSSQPVQDLLASAKSPS